MTETFFDDWPLIWKAFKAANCATFYSEDNPDYNCYNYLAKGFHQKPVDHFMRYEPVICA